MDKKQLKQAIFAVAIGAMITLASNILQLLLNFLLEYKEHVIPAASGMVYWLKNNHFTPHA